MMTGLEIILVEDHPADEMLMLRALRRANVGNPVRVARDGAEALDMLFAQPEPGAQPPMVVFLDIKLPKLNGFDVLERLRADPRTRHVPVVMLSSSDDQNDVRRSYLLGANSYVQKPMANTDYSEVVQTMANYWAKCNLSPLA